MSSSCAWYKLFEIRRLIFHVGNPNDSLLHRRKFARRSLVLADMLTTVVRDLEDHCSASSTCELTSRVRISSQPSRFKTAVFVCTSHVLFSYRKFTLSKFFRELNFRCRLDLRKYFNTEIFPTYGNLYWLRYVGD